MKREKRKKRQSVKGKGKKETEKAKRGKISPDRLAVNTSWLSNVRCNSLHFLYDCT
jgi:hypothetical protein